MELQGQVRDGDKGYAMAALLVAIAITTIALSVAMPAWRHMMQREKEEELIFRGQQYARAIGLFQRKYAAAYPPDVDTLVKQKFLRRKFRDPMVSDGEFQVLYQASQGQLGQQVQQRGQRGGQQGATTSRITSSLGGQQGSPQPAGPRGGVIGVASKSTATSLRLYNGRNHYNEWQFIYAPALFGPGQQRPGMRPGQRGPGGVPRGPGAGRGPGNQPGPGQRNPGENPFPPRNPR